MRLDDDGNLHAVMPLVEQKKVRLGLIWKI